MRATIDDSASICTLINTFTVSPERQEAVVASLRIFSEQHASILTGFIGASVHASLDGKRVVNYAQWASEADLDKMLASPAAKLHMAEVSVLAEKIEPVLYRVAYVEARDDEPL